MPSKYDPLHRFLTAGPALPLTLSFAQIEQFLGNVEATIKRCVEVMPSHADYLRKFCPAEPVA